MTSTTGALSGTEEEEPVTDFNGLTLTFEFALQQKCDTSMVPSYSLDSISVFDDFFVAAETTEYNYKKVNDGYKGPFLGVLIVFLILNLVLIVILVILCRSCRRRKAEVEEAEKEKNNAKKLLET